MKNIIGFTIFMLLFNMFSAVFYSLDKVNAQDSAVKNNKPVHKVIAGGRNSAIIKMDGTVWLWGDNSENQLGRENVKFSSTPVSAIGLKNIKSISTSNRFSMAVMEDGTLWWWGNSFFPIQDSYNTGYSKSNIPVQLEGIDNVKEVSLAEDYAIILKRDGTVYSVGSSYFGRLGTGGSIDDPNRGGYVQVISQIETLKNVVAVSVSKEYALALKEDGTVWAWGRNNYGQLGDGTLNSSSNPIQVLLANKIKKIVAGENTSFAIDETGFLWGWGRNSNYLIGSGSGSSSLSTTPTLVYNLANVISVEANSNFALIKKSDGTIWGWGKNSNGLLKEADYEGGTVGPTLLNDLDGIANFKTAPEAIIAVTASGKVKIKGKLFGKVDSEFKVENLDYISNVSLSEDHVLALNEEGMVKAWGKNDVGQLGNGNLINSNVPLMLQGITNIEDVKLSINSFILLNSAGEVFIVGSRGKTNNSTIWPGAPNVYKIDGLNQVKKIATSGYDVLALTEDGSIWKYTRSSGGDPISFLTKEINQGDFIDIACSNDHYVALKEDGTVWNWGNNDNGQLGDGTLISRTTPVKTLNLDHVTAIHAQPGITIALRDDGTVWGWGSSHSYLLGPNSQAKRILPTQIHGLSNIKELYITENRAFAKDADHVFYGWGEAFGIINNPTDQFLSSPVKMDDGEGVQEIFPSSQFQLMVKSDGSIYAKGINYEGELGIGSYKYAYEPTKVVFDPRSSLANIVTFSIGNELVPAQIDLMNHEVMLIVPSDTDLTNVRPYIGISVGSTIDPSNEVYQDYTLPVDYNVNAEDGTIEKWKVTVLKNTDININVQFETFGGTLLENQIKNFYDLSDRPEDPKKKGYEFKGWYKDENLSSEFDFTKKLTEDITLYAKWEPKNYTVSFDVQGGSFIEDIHGTYGTAIQEPEKPMKTGYAFRGWYKDPQYYTAWDFKSDKLTDNIILYAKWEPNEYTIHFDSRGGSNIVDYVGQYGMTIAIPEYPIKVGYTFIGWYKDRFLTSLWNFVFDTVASDQTLYANWKINKYTVTFNSQGGSQVVGQTVNFNSTVSPPATPKKTGYTLEGWYKEASCIHQWDFSKETVKENTTLYAKWIPNPAKPSSPKATSASYNSIKINWNGVSGANGYEVYRATSSTGKYSSVVTTSSTNFTHTGLTTNTSYYYKVRAYKMVGSIKVYGDFSLIVTAKPVPSVPGSVKAASASYNSIKTSWAVVSGTNGYAIYRATSSTGTYLYVGTTTSTSYTNTGLKTNKTYYYKVRAYRIIGSSKVYGDYSGVVSAKPVPTVPSSVKAASTSYNSIKTSWRTVSGANGYSVYRATSSTGTYSYLGATTATSYTNTGLRTNKTFYYKVRAYRLVGNSKIYGNYSGVVSAKPVPSIPANLKAAKYSHSSIKLTWSKVSGATGYQVYRATSKTGTYSYVKGMTSSSYINTSLRNKKTYYYKIRAYRTVGKKKVYSGWSTIVSAMPY
jgi:uncharacterized repeat protein (TIGR02543 family)